MVLELYGYPKSTCTRLVALVAKEKEVPFKIIPIDLAKREHKTPEYIKSQPFGQVPYIKEDDGFILYESRAIARYLIKKYPNQGTPGLIPTDVKEEAVFEQASSVEAFNFNSHASALVGEAVFKKFRGGEPDQAKVKEYSEKVKATLDVYEVILGKHQYLAGDKLTLADLQHLPYGSLLFAAGLGDEITKRPNVNRWWQKIVNRPTWQAIKDGIPV